MSVRSQLHGHIAAALHRLAHKHGTEGTPLPRISLVPPKSSDHGDLSTPVALAAARVWQLRPRDAAEAIKAELQHTVTGVERIDIAGPGHLNFFMSAGVWRDVLHQVATLGEAALMKAPDPDSRILLEYVSANPTGPLHVAHGRGAVHGDVLARLLKAAGKNVHREYYINDLGRQTDVMAESIYLRYGELLGRPFHAPEDFYPGAYITELAQALIDRDGDRCLGADPEDYLPLFRAFGIERMLCRIRADLTAFNVSFDSWVSEAEICRPETLADVSLRLRAAGHTFEEDGKVWFRSTTFGDDKDRVILRDDGRPTYFLTDLAYHDAKARRGFGRLVNIWGADHGGYVARVRAGLEALGHDPQVLQVLLVQMVSLSQAGEAVRMGKRLGTAVWLDEVIKKAGSGATRYLFSMRRIDAQMDFDIDLAMRRTIENPVYYAQMGHARMAAIARKADALGIQLSLPERAHLEALTLPEELQMLRTLARAPDVIEDAADALEPHQIVHYMQDLIGQFHSYYTRYKHTEKVVSGGPHKDQARLLMCRGLQTTLKFLLTLLGVAAPETMHLTDDDALAFEA